MHMRNQHRHQCCWEKYLKSISVSSLKSLDTLGMAAVELQVGKDRPLFFAFLNVFQERLASDPRDKIFAPSGLGGTMLADYSLQPVEAFLYAVRTLVADNGSLAFLLRVPELDRSADVPKWVPDWCAKVRRETLFMLDLDWILRFQCFDAALGTRAVMLDLP